MRSQFIFELSLYSCILLTNKQKNPDFNINSKYSVFLRLFLTFFFREKKIPSFCRYFPDFDSSRYVFSGFWCFLFLTSPENDVPENNSYSGRTFFLVSADVTLSVIWLIGVLYAKIPILIALFSLECRPSLLRTSSVILLPKQFSAGRRLFFEYIRVPPTLYRNNRFREKTRIKNNVTRRNAL